MISTKFWDVLAPHHSAIEDNYLDIASARRILEDLREPVLVVGAGQGLIVAEVRKSGLQCDGLDFSPEMVRQAKIRRGLNLIQADATAMPFRDATYATIIYATGVIDFCGDEQAIRLMLDEGKRVVQRPGKIFIAFYRLSHALEDFLVKTGLVVDSMVSHRECLQMYLINPAQMVPWVAKRTGSGYLGAVALLLRLSVLGSLREKTMTFKVQKIFRDMEDPNALIQAASEKQPYRNEAEIRRLFERLTVPIKEIRTMPSCWIVETSL